MLKILSVGINFLRGSSGRKWSKLSNFCFFAQKVSSGTTSQISRGLAALEPHLKWREKGGVFISFSIENEKENGKNICTFCRKSFKDSKTDFFFHCSLKTEDVLFLYIYKYIYIYIYIYLYIYEKLSNKWKNCHEQKVFLFRFYILCENFSKIGPIIKKWGAMGGSTGGPNLTFFNVYFHYLFIYSSNI